MGSWLLPRSGGEAGTTSGNCGGDAVGSRRGVLLSALNVPGSRNDLRLLRPPGGTLTTLRDSVLWGDLSGPGRGEDTGREAVTPRRAISWHGRVLRPADSNGRKLAYSLLSQ